MRPILFAIILSACASAPKVPCEFPLWVHVMSTESADEQCRIAGVKRRDDGSFIKDTDTIKGCAHNDWIITNGTESNMGHELKHLVDWNCK